MPSDPWNVRLGRFIAEDLFPDLGKALNDLEAASYADGVAAAGERIRRAILDAIESTADVIEITSGQDGEESEGPVEMCDKEALLEALAQIIPEKE